MSDETDSSSTRSPADELAARYARYRDNHSAWLDRNSTKLLFAGIFLMPLCGLGLIPFFIWGFSHGLLALLDVIPRVRFSLGALFAAVITLPIPITLFASKLDPAIELVACILLAIWITVVAVHLSNAVRADREKHPDRTPPPPDVPAN